MWLYVDMLVLAPACSHFSLSPFTSKTLYASWDSLKHRGGCWCRYPTSIAEDDAVVADRHAGAREKVAARLVRIEKAILQGM